MPTHSVPQQGCATQLQQLWECRATVPLATRASGQRGTSHGPPKSLREGCKLNGNKETLQHAGTPGEVSPAAPPLTSHLAQREAQGRLDLRPRSGTAATASEPQKNSPGSPLLVSCPRSTALLPSSTTATCSGGHLLAMLPHSATGSSHLPAGEEK